MNTHLIINGHIVYVPQDIDVRLLNPMFYPEESFIYNFNLHSEPITNLALGFVNLPDSLERFKEIKNVHLIAGNFQLFGILMVDATSKKSYKCNFIANNTYSTLKETNLNEITGSYTIPNRHTNSGDFLNYLQDTLDNPNNYDFSFFPITDPYYKSGSLGEEPFSSFGQNYPFNTGKSNINNDKYNNLSSISNSFIVPFFKLSVIIKKINDFIGCSILENPITSDPDLAKLYFMNSCAIMDFEILTDQFTAIEITSIADGEITTNGAHNLTNSDIVYLRTPYDYRFEDVKERAYRIELIENEPTKLKLADVEIPNWSLTGCTITKCKIQYTVHNEIKLEKHLAYCKISQFIQELEKFLFIKFFYVQGGSECIIKNLNKVLGSSDVEPIDHLGIFDKSNNMKFVGKKGLTVKHKPDTADKYNETIKPFPSSFQRQGSVNLRRDLPIPANYNDVRLVKEMNIDYVFSKETFINNNESVLGNWRKLTLSQANPYVEKEGEMIFDSEFSPVYEKYSSVYQNPFAVMAKPIGCYNFEENVDRKGLRLVFYRGIHSVSSNNTTPIVTSSVYKTIDNKIEDANLSLDLTSQYGLVEKRGKPWVRWNAYDRRDDEIYVHWPEYMLNNPEMWKKRSLCTNPFFIKSIAFKIKPNTSREMGKTEIAWV